MVYTEGANESNVHGALSQRCLYYIFKSLLFCISMGFFITYGCLGSYGQEHILNPNMETQYEEEQEKVLENIKTNQKNNIWGASAFQPFSVYRGIKTRWPITFAILFGTNISQQRALQQQFLNELERREIETVKEANTKILKGGGNNDLTNISDIRANRNEAINKIFDKMAKANMFNRDSPLYNSILYVSILIFFISFVVALTLLIIRGLASGIIEMPAVISLVLKAIIILIALVFLRPIMLNFVAISDVTRFAVTEETKAELKGTMTYGQDKIEDPNIFEYGAEILRVRMDMVGLGDSVNLITLMEQGFIHFVAKLAGWCAGILGAMTLFVISIVTDLMLAFCFILGPILLSLMLIPAIGKHFSGWIKTFVGVLLINPVLDVLGFLIVALNFVLPDIGIIHMGISLWIGLGIMMRLPEWIDDLNMSLGVDMAINLVATLSISNLIYKQVAKMAR